MSGRHLRLVAAAALAWPLAYLMRGLQILTVGKGIVVNIDVASGTRDWPAVKVRFMTPREARS